MVTCLFKNILKNFHVKKVVNWTQFPPGLEPPLPPLSEANIKSYPLFLRAIQIGACKLEETL